MRKNALSSPSNLLPSLPFFLTKQKSLNTERNKRDTFRSSRERTHLAFERSFAHFCAYLISFFSRVFFPFVDKFRSIPRDLHKKRVRCCVFFYFSPRARDTRAARVRCKTVKRGPRDEMIAEVFLRVLLCAMMRVYSRARAKAKEMVL